MSDEFSYRVSAVIDDPWRSMEPLIAGDPSGFSESPSEYVTVTQSGRPFLRIDFFYRGHDHGYFFNVSIWQHWLIIGYGLRVHWVNLETRKLNSIILEAPFNAFFPLSEKMLVSTDGGAAAFDPFGLKLWENSLLSICYTWIESVNRGDTDHVLILRGSR